MKLSCTCIVLSCVAGSAFADPPYADSVAEFSGVQGQDGWYYGYYRYDAGDTPNIPATFHEMEDFDTGSPVAGGWSQAGTDDWAFIGANLMHPHLAGFSHQEPAEYWVSRRWVSDITGVVHVICSVNTFEPANTGGDGVELYVFHNGAAKSIWVLGIEEHWIFDFALNLDVEVGDFIEFVVGPRQDIAFDGVAFNAIIGPPPPACPGDITGDSVTNSADFNVLALNFGAAVTPGEDGDITGDGVVDSADFNVLAGDFGCDGNP